MKLKLLFFISQNWKRIFQMNAFVVFILEIHLSYVGSDSSNNMYKKRALVQQGC